jgi:hypothetical protein
LVSFAYCADVRVSVGTPASVSTIDVTWPSPFSASRLAATSAAVSEIVTVSAS